MAGRIETYTHSDMTVKNKGACVVEVTCETDFAARTPEFIEFCAYAAKMVYAAQTDTQGFWNVVVDAFPEAEEKRLALAATLKEEVVVRDATIMQLTDEWTLNCERHGYKGEAARHPKDRTHTCSTERPEITAVEATQLIAGFDLEGWNAGGEPIMTADSVVGDDGRCRKCRAVQPEGKGVFGTWHEVGCEDRVFA